jgi:Tol biopolymer transport system component
MRRLFVWAVVSITTTLWMVAPGGSAQATFPGQDGRIAFSTGSDGSEPLTSQIFTVGPDGSGVHQLTHVAKGKHSLSPDFSPDGKKILYQSDVTGNNEIWAMAANGSGKVQLTDNPDFQNLHPRWSPDGARIVFSRCIPLLFGLQDCHIAVMNADGTGLVTLTRGHWVDSNPEFSPDGSRIAFDSNRGGLESAVWVMNSNGTGAKRLTAPNLEAIFADWSPDGTHIAFSTNCCRPTGTNLWVMRADGSGAHALTHVPSDHNAGVGSYAPSGKRIVLISDIRYPDICCNDLYVMNADGSNLHTIVRNKPTVFFSDWGPAG